MKTISLVLGSGGARGYAHVGVIRALEERGYEIKGIAGCSMGALIGGFYAAGKLDDFEEWVSTLSYLDVLKLVDLSLLSSGAIRGDKIFALLSEMLGSVKIEQLKIPYTAVATDLTNQKEVWFNSGPLEQAIRASCSIPSVVRPVVMGNRLLVDGGVLNPLPIAASIAVHADHIFAVDLSAEVPMPEGSLKETQAMKMSHEQEKEGWFAQVRNKAMSFLDREPAQAQAELDANLSKLGVMYQMFDTMQASLTQYKIAGYRPDLLIRIPKNSVSIFEFYRAEAQIQLGYDIALQAIKAFEKGEANTYGQL
ncbi:alpha/beta hydrolase [Bermanella sp. 47_1433_sub80_T6]|nr:alpha/beta hydrolase [Bermanella sp. 47_1433_sub80_T6]